MSLNSFGKNFRLLKTNDFQSLKKNSYSINNELLSLKYIKNDKANCSRLGLIITKKFGNAVKRNQLKRIIREEFRKSEVKSMNYDFIFISKPVKKNKNSEKLTKVKQKEQVVFLINKFLSRNKL